MKKSKKFKKKCPFCGKFFKTNLSHKKYCSVEHQIKDNSLRRYTKCKFCGGKMLKGSSRCKRCFSKKKFGSLSRTRYKNGNKKV